MLEVQQHLGDGWLRAVAMSTTDGLKRGMTLVDTGKPIAVPVGKQILGRIFNVTGDLVDENAALADANLRAPIHRPAPTLGTAVVHQDQRTSRPATGRTQATHPLRQRRRHPSIRRSVQADQRRSQTHLHPLVGPEKHPHPSRDVLRQGGAGSKEERQDHEGPHASLHRPFHRRLQQLRRNPAQALRINAAGMQQRHRDDRPPEPLGQSRRDPPEAERGSRTQRTIVAEKDRCRNVHGSNRFQADK